MSYRKSLFTIVLLGASLFGLVACSGEDGNMKVWRAATACAESSTD